MINKVRRKKPVPKEEKGERPTFAQFLKQKDRSKWDFGESDRLSRHHFLGFHDRIKKIDVKLSHNPDKITGLDTLQGLQTSLEELMTSRTSYYIDSLNSHNMLNASLSYEQISNKLMPLSTTFPMVVNNLEKIVDLILNHFKDTDPHCKNALLDFIIAIIKDTRQHIFQLFLSKIMPTLIQMITIDDLDSLDKIFTTFSYAFKFLQRPILNDLHKVYLCYYELLAHNNKHIRKFAAEGFSYIIRTFKKKQLKWGMDIILDPLMNTQNYLQLSESMVSEQFDFSQKNVLSAIRGGRKDEMVDSIIDSIFQKERLVNGKIVTSHTMSTIVYAISQLMYEVMQGTQGCVHSKAEEFLCSLLSCINSHEKEWLSIFYICRYTIVILLEYLDPNNDKVIHDSLLTAFRPIYSTFFLTNASSSTIVSENDEMTINMIIAMWKDWVAFINGRKISDFSTTQILQYLNCLLCQNQHLFAQFSYLTQKNIIQCLALVYSLKYQVCSEFYQFNNPFTTKVNLMKKQLFELKPYRLIYEFLRFLTFGYDSVLRFSQVLGDTLKQNFKVEIPVERQKQLFANIYDNCVQSTFQILADPSVDINDTKARLLYVLKMAKLLDRSVEISKEGAESVFKMMCTNSKLWLELSDPAAMTDISSNNESDIFDICLFLDAISRTKSEAVITSSAPMLLNVSKNIAAKIKKEGIPDATSFSPEETYAERIQNLACTYFAFKAYNSSNTFFYVSAFSRMIVLLCKQGAAASILNELLAITADIFPLHRTNAHLLEGLEHILKLTCSLRDPLLISEATGKINLKIDEILGTTSSIPLPRSIYVEVYRCLKKNLSCNLRSVRLKSLKLLNTMFNDSEDCGIIRLLYKFEEPEIGLETERDKTSFVRDIKLALQTKRVCLRCRENYAEIEDYTDLKLIIIGILRLYRRVCKYGEPADVSGKIIELLLEFVKSEYNRYFPELKLFFGHATEKDAESETELLEVMRKVNVYDSSEETQKLLKGVSKDKMRGFLEILSEIENFDKMEKSQVTIVNQILQQMITNSDEKVQKLAIDSLGKIGHDYAKHNLAMLQNIASKTQSKELLQSINMQTIPESERTDLLSTIVLILYGKLTKKKGKKTKSHSRNMTTTIFNFISSLTKEEIITSVRTILAKSLVTTSEATLGSSLAKVPLSKMRGLCYTIKLIIKNLGRLIDDLVPILGSVVLWILRLSLLYYTKDTSNMQKKIAHTIYIEAIKRLKELYSHYYETEHLEKITEGFVELVKDKIGNMKTELSQGKSNLLGIFLIWSSNAKQLQQYFVKYPVIFESLFQLLTATKLVPEVATMVFQILFNLLFSENEVRVCTPLFESKIDFIVDCIHFYLSRKDIESNKISANIFAMLSELATYLTPNSETIKKLIELLTPHMFLAVKKRKNYSDSFIHLIRTLKILFTKHTTTKLHFFPQFAPLLLRTRDCATRYELAELLTILAGEDKEMEKYAKMGQAMNSFTRRGTETEPDFDAVIKAMNEFNAILSGPDHDKLVLNHIKVIIYNFLSSLSHDDYSVRSAAAHGLKQFFQGKYKEVLKQYGTSPETADYINFIVNDFMPVIRIQMKVKDEILFRGVLEVLRSYLISSKDLYEEKRNTETFNEGLHFDLISLLNIPDEEQDFYCNIMHSQLQMRFKALRMAATAITEKKLTIATEMRIMLPLANSFLFFQEDNDDEKKKKVVAYKKSGHARQVVADSIELIGAIVPHLSPDQYFGLLKRYTIRLQKGARFKEVTQNVIINALCKILDKFAFDVPDSLAAFEQEVERKLVGKDPAEDLIGIIKNLAHENIENQTSPEVRELLAKMKRFVLPALKNGMTNVKKSKDTEGERHQDVRPNVALALVRIIRKLNVRHYLEEYEKIITILVAPLRSKDVELRDKVRSVIYEIVDTSSPYTLHILISEMISGLTRDYQRHVLLYTMNGIFQRIIKTLKDKYVGKIEHCVQLLLPLIMKGVTGLIAEEAETEEVVKQCREAKESRAPELYGTIAQLINVEASLSPLIKPLIEELENTKDVRNIHKCENALNKISDGVMKNPSLTPKTLISTCKSTIDKGLELVEKKDEEIEEAKFTKMSMAEHKAQNFIIQEGAAGGKRVSLKLRKESKNEQLSGKAICLFGFSMLHTAINRGFLPMPPPAKKSVEEEKKELAFGEIEPAKPTVEPMVIESPENTEWAEQIIPSLIKAMKSPYTQLVQVALKIYDLLLNKQINALQEHAQELLAYLIKQFDYLNLSDQEMVHCVFRCITHIIETKSSTISLSKPQLIALLDLIKNNIREAEKEIQVFRCVRAIVNSKIKLKKIEEIVDYISELMITTFNRNIRENCGSIFIDYVLKHIDINSQKLVDRMQFILKNLSYEDEDARLYLLTLLNKLLAHVLKTSQVKWIDTLFVTLVLRMANEDSAKCKKKIIDTIEQILNLVPKDVQKQMVGSVLIWLKDPNCKPSLKVVCFQLVGVIAKVLRDAFVPHLDLVINKIEETVRNSLLEMEKEKENAGKNEDEEVHDEIKEIMKSVKLIENDPEEEVKANRESKQEWTICYMSLICLEKLFEHIKGHLLNSLKPKESLIMNNVAKLLEHKHYWIKLLACRVIGYYFSDRDVATMVQEIVFFKEKSEKEIGMKLLGLFKSQYLDDQLATQATKNVLFIVKSFVGREDENEAVHTILTKATNYGKTIISGNESERQKLKYLIKLAGGIVLCMTEEKLKEEIHLSLSLIYRVATSDLHKGTESSKLSFEIMEAISQKIGVDKYTEGLTKLKADIQLSRLERKRKTKEIKLTNPEVAAMVKAKQKEKGREKKKLKNREWAAKRTGVSAYERTTVTKKSKKEN